MYNLAKSTYLLRTVARSGANTSPANMAYIVSHIAIMASFKHSITEYYVAPEIAGPHTAR